MSRKSGFFKLQFWGFCGVWRGMQPGRPQPLGCAPYSIFHVPYSRIWNSGKQALSNYTSMQKGTENEQLGKPIYPNIPSARSTYHRTTGKRTQPNLRTSATATEQRWQYTSRHHTDKYSAYIQKQIAYHHKPEQGKAWRLTHSNYARHRNGPLMMVRRLTETCWVFVKLILSTQHGHF